MIIFFVADNRAPELSSMPMVPSSEYLFPLNAETPSSMPPTPSSMPVIMHGHDPAMSSVSFGMGAAHSSEASKMELGPTLPGQQLSASNFNAVSKIYDSWYFSFTKRDI